MKDHYNEYMEAGVMPGNLENDRLLTCEEMAALYSKRAMFPTDWCEAQDAKSVKERDKWWIEKIEKLGQCNGECWDGGFVIIVNGLDWLALKKQIGGE